MQQPTRLPIVRYEHHRWFFDERLHQLRNVENPHDVYDLNDFELAYFRAQLAR